MSGLVCALSGEVPSEPVVSTKSGHLFERKLITKYVEESGNCPVTGAPLTVDDLVAVQSNAGVRDEWGSTVSECYQLRKLLEETRQELSHTLYQHDAACRVISRLVKERDAARQALADASAAGKLYAGAPSVAPPAAAAAADGMDVDSANAEETGLTDAIKEKMVKMAGELSKSRKKRVPSASLAAEEAVAKYQEKSSHPVHLANAILCLDVHASNPNMVVTGGADNNVVLMDRSTGQAAHKMKGHSKKINSVLLHTSKDMAFSCSADKTVKVWAPSTGKCVYTFKEHKADVAGISVHATGDYLVSASMDKTWALYDLGVGVCRKVVADAAVTGGFTAASFHPDGLILGTATTDKLVRVWDVKTQQNVVTFVASDGPLSSIAFSENGFSLVTAGPGGFKTWDLRKVAKMGAQAQPVQVLKAINGEANQATYDYSGQYLACAGSKGIVVYETKSYKPVLSLEDCHGNSVAGVSFGPDARYLASCSKDRTLKFFELGA